MLSTTRSSAVEGRESLLATMRTTQLSPRDMRRLHPSSQRDAAAGYSRMLAESLAGTPEFRAKPTLSCDAWWSLGRVANVHPRKWGA